MFAADAPYTIYFDRAGAPLDGGYLYFGVEDQDPETHPVQVFWDAAGTQPAAQPIRTISGFPVRAGSIADVYVNGAFSMTVRDSASRLVRYTPSSQAFSYVTNLTTSGGASFVGWIQAGLGAVMRWVQDKLRDWGAPQDFGGAVDGSTDDSAALADMTAVGKPFVVSGKSAYQYGVVGPAIGTVNRTNVATLGSETVTNPTFASSVAPWTATNFTWSAGSVAHTAGTVGQISQPLTLKPYKQYLISVTLSTTARGMIDFQFGGLTMLDDAGYYAFDVAGSTTFQFAYFNYATTASTLLAITDVAWAGAITQISLVELADEMPFTFVNVAADDLNMRIPQGLKFGRYNAGVYGVGDRQMMAFTQSDAVWNVAFGPRTLATNQHGFENTAVGAFTLKYTTSPRNVAYGYSAGKYNTLGTDLCFLGYKAGTLNTTGNRNTAIGTRALFQNSATSDNVAVGYQTLYSALTGGLNTAIGSQVAMNCNGGTENTYLGALSGFLNASTNVTYSYNYTTSIGAESKVYGNKGIALGWLAVVGSDPNNGGASVDNSIAIGIQVTNKVANTAKIGNGLSVTAVSGQISSVQSLPSVTATSGMTLTAAQMLGGVITRSGPAAGFTDTTPTAAQIVAAIGGAETSSGFDMYIRNVSGQTLTLAAGSGVTLAGNTSISAGQCRYYRVQITNATPGSEAVFLLGVFTAAA